MFPSNQGGSVLGCCFVSGCLSLFIYHWFSTDSLSGVPLNCDLALTPLMVGLCWTFV